MRKVFIVSVYSVQRVLSIVSFFPLKFCRVGILLFDTFERSYLPARLCKVLLELLRDGSVDVAIALSAGNPER